MRDAPRDIQQVRRAVMRRRWVVGVAVVLVFLACTWVNNWRAAQADLRLTSADFILGPESPLLDRTVEAIELQARGAYDHLSEMVDPELKYEVRRRKWGADWCKLPIGFEIFGKRKLRVTVLGVDIVGVRPDPARPGRIVGVTVRCRYEVGPADSNVPGVYYEDRLQWSYRDGTWYISSFSRREP